MDFEFFLGKVPGVAVPPVMPRLGRTIGTSATRLELSMSQIPIGWLMNRCFLVGGDWNMTVIVPY